MIVMVAFSNTYGCPRLDANNLFLWFSLFVTRKKLADNDAKIDKIVRLVNIIESLNDLVSFVSRR